MIKFKDEVWFERHLKSIGFNLIGDYKTDYFTTYGTTVRAYERKGDIVHIGLTSGVFTIEDSLNKPRETRIGIITRLINYKDTEDYNRLISLPTNEEEAKERFIAMGIVDDKIQK